MEKNLEQSYGKLSGLRFPHILKEIEDKNLDGILRIEKGNLIKEIYFSRGNPINARSNLTKETLGRVLLDRGFISREDYNNSLEIVKKTGKKHGEVLMQMGVLPFSLKKALKMQVEERILDIFSWQEAHYRFIPNEKITDLVDSFDIPPERIIYKGIVSKLDYSLLESVLNQYENKKLLFKDNSEKLERISLSSNYKSILSLFDGGKTVKKVIEESGVDSIDLSKIILTGLLLNFITVVREEDSAKLPDEIEPTIEEEILTERDKGMLNVLSKNLEEYKNKNYFEIFNLQDNFNDRDLKKAYFNLARSYHPDRFTRFHIKVRSLAEELFSLINEAFNVLSDPEARSNYTAMIRSGGRAITEKDAQKAINAELEFQKSEVFLREGKLDKAYEHIKKAIELNEEEPEYQIYLAWIKYRLGKRMKKEELAKEGKSALERTLGNAQGSEKGHFFLAQIYKIEGDVARAVQEFQKVISINSENVDAKRELRILLPRLKTGTEGEKKGLFKKLFK